MQEAPKLPKNLPNDWRTAFPAIKSSAMVYLDSASSCQVPQQVIDAMSNYYQSGHGNPHRGMYTYSENAEHLLNQCRQLVANLIHCDAQQVAFCSGTTAGINLIARGIQPRIKPHQSIIVTQMEHHANLLPWQKLSQDTGAELKVVPVKENFELDLERLNDLMDDSCALLACTQMSNVTGTINPLAKIGEMAKSKDCIFVVDGAQSIAHMPVDVAELNCDYFVFSAHKLYGPTGIGAIYMRQPNIIDPLNLGGGIVNRVTDTNFVLTDSIERFEAGSINMAGIAGFVAALEFIKNSPFEAICAHEKHLIEALRQYLSTSDYQILAHQDSHNIISLAHKQYHSHDIATILSEKNVAVRAGHHCAQPFLTALGLKHCVRISLGMYNNLDDIQQLIDSLDQVPGFLE